MKLFSRLVGTLSLVALLSSPAFAAPEALDRSVEAGVKTLIPEGFTTNDPVASKVGTSQRKSYFIYKKPGADGRGFYAPPLVLVETLDGKVITNDRIGDDWGWTSIRPARSVGLGDPHHDLELREYTNGLETRVIGLADGYRMTINRGTGKAEPFLVKGAPNYEVQLGDSNGTRVLVENLNGKFSVFALNGTTFQPDAKLTALANKGGSRSLPNFFEAWSSRTSGVIAPQPAPAAPANPAPVPAKATAPAGK